MLIRKKLKFVVLAAAVLLAIASSTVLLINYRVQSFSSQYILDAASVPQTDAILVLGAYVAPNGQPSDMLKDRLDTALEVHGQTNNKFLVSGDHGRTTYDEVNSMKKYIMDKHIYRGIEAYELREIAARNKDFLYVNVFRPKPTFLGEAIPISGDGRLTNDHTKQ